MIDTQQAHDGIQTKLAEIQGKLAAHAGLHGKTQEKLSALMAAVLGHLSEIHVRLGELAAQMSATPAAKPAPAHPVLKPGIYRDTAGAAYKVTAVEIGS